MSKRSASGLGFIPPQLPTLVDGPPKGEDWIHEIKFDGYRSQVVIDGSGVRIFTRNGFDWTEKYAPIAAAATAMDIGSQAVIDGEIIVADEKGKPRFGELRAAIKGASHRLVFMAFDLLHLNGHDLRELPVEDRRHILEDLIEPNSRIQFSEELQGSASDIYVSLDRAGLEGMVSKRRGSPYQSGRSREWLKAKCYEERDFDIIGVQRDRGKPAMVLMADKGRYVGAAFVTFPKEIRERLWARVQARAGGKAPPGLAKKKAEWIKPGLRGRAKFLRGEEKLRHASLKSFEEGNSG